MWEDWSLRQFAKLLVLAGKVWPVCAGICSVGNLNENSQLTKLYTRVCVLVCVWLRKVLTLRFLAKWSDISMDVKGWPGGPRSGFVRRAGRFTLYNSANWDNVQHMTALLTVETSLLFHFLVSSCNEVSGNGACGCEQEIGKCLGLAIMISDAQVLNAEIP